jgi:hypothetical protein
MPSQNDQSPEGGGQPRRLRDQVRDAVCSVDGFAALTFVSTTVALLALSSGRSRPVLLRQWPRMDPRHAEALAGLIRERSRSGSIPGAGSPVQCADGSLSHAGGRQGACSHHGGIA